MCFHNILHSSLLWFLDLVTFCLPDLSWVYLTKCLWTGVSDSDSQSINNDKSRRHTLDFSSLKHPHTHECTGESWWGSVGPRCPFSEATVTKAACLFEKSSSPLSPVPQRRNAEGDVCQRTRAGAFYAALLYSGETQREESCGVTWKWTGRKEVGERNDKDKNEYSILINVLNRWVSCWMASFCNYSQTFRRGTVARCLHPWSRSTRRLQLSARCQCNPRG